MAPASPGNAVCYLFVDTETTGTFRFGRPPPRPVEVACLVCEVSGEVVERGERIVRPDDFTVQAVASRIHGITTGYARQAGVSVLEALEALCLAASRSSTVVAHNSRFDRAVIAEEGRRNGVPAPLSNLPGICTMGSTAPVCGIRRVGGGDYKWPALSELYRSLFGVTYERSVHRAADDVEACAWAWSRERLIKTPPDHPNRPPPPGWENLRTNPPHPPAPATPPRPHQNSL